MHRYIVNKQLLTIDYKIINKLISIANNNKKQYNSQYNLYNNLDWNSSVS